MDTTIINNKIHALCKRCNEYKIAHSQAGMYFEGGITLRFLGGYAEYYDPCTSKEDDLVQINLCHECTVKTLKFVGVYNNEHFLGGHPTQLKDEPCCDNCWIPVYENGKWVAIKDPQGNITLNNPY